MLRCYQCSEEVNYLFDDGRGRCCTRLTPEEITGEVSMKSDVTVEDIRKALINQLSQHEGWAESDIPWEHTFAEVGLDSLDVIEMIMEIEDELDIELPRVLDEFAESSTALEELPKMLFASISGTIAA